jgi:pimeloyl-ACP methyl ester carboxylesterase
MVQVDPTHDRTFDGFVGRLSASLVSIMPPSLIRRRGQRAMLETALKGFADLGPAAAEEFVDRYYEPKSVRAMVGEMRACLAQASQLRLQSLGEIPLVVVGAGKVEGPSRLVRQRRAHLEELASLSKRGELRIAENSGHVVPFDQPQAVIDAVLDVVRAAREAEAR